MLESLPPPQYVCPCTKTTNPCAIFQIPFLCVSPSLSMVLFYSVQLIQRPRTVQYAIIGHSPNTVYGVPHINSTTQQTCQCLRLHHHLMTSQQAEVFFATSANVVIFPMTPKVIEVTRNTSAAAPDFPNVALKVADAMFLALILYLS